MEKVLKLRVKGGIIIFRPGSYLLSKNPEEGKEDKEVDEEIFELHRKYLSAILRKKNRNKVMVDWLEYARVIRNANYQIRNDIERYINTALIILGILTENRENAWTFSDRGMNPAWGVSKGSFDTIFLGRAYFVNESDIIGYASNFWKNRMIDDWAIFQMKNAREKEEVC
jgi:hypothetical protein